jgi:hypothetical protein
MIFRLRFGRVANNSNLIFDSLTLCSFKLRNNIDHFLGSTQSRTYQGQSSLCLLFKTKFTVDFLDATKQSGSLAWLKHNVQRSYILQLQIDCLEGWFLRVFCFRKPIQKNSLVRFSMDWMTSRV